MRCYFLTYILIGVPSVCRHIDKENAPASEVTQIDSVAAIQSPRLVIVNGAICG